jgi:hypothetical protein
MARKKWDQRCKKTKNCCGLIITKGLMGGNRGIPQLEDMLALYEVAAIDLTALGMGVLEKQMKADWDLEY